MPKKGDIRKGQLESHPQFDRILQAIVENRSDTEIMKWAYPKISKMCLWRFRTQRMSAVMAKPALPASMAAQLQAKGLLPDTPEVQQIVAATSALAVADDPLLQRIHKHQGIIDKRLKNSKLTDGGAAALINTDLKGIELYAKLTHRLDAPSTGVNITIVNPQPTQSPNNQSPIIDIGVSQ